MDCRPAIRSQMKIPRANIATNTAAIKIQLILVPPSRTLMGTWIVSFPKSSVETSFEDPRGGRTSVTVALLWRVLRRDPRHGGERGQHRERPREGMPSCEHVVTPWATEPRRANLKSTRPQSIRVK